MSIKRYINIMYIIDYINIMVCMFMVSAIYTKTFIDICVYIYMERYIGIHLKRNIFIHIIIYEYFTTLYRCLFGPLSFGTTQIKQVDLAKTNTQ